MTAPLAEKSAEKSASFTSMTIHEVALLASKMQPTVMEEMIRADIEEGAPTNQDGTMNILHYAAWLAKKGLRR